MPHRITAASGGDDQWAMTSGRRETRAAPEQNANAGRRRNCSGTVPGSPDNATVTLAAAPASCTIGAIQRRRSSSRTRSVRTNAAPDTPIQYPKATGSQEPNDVNAARRSTSSM